MNMDESRSRKVRTVELLRVGDHVPRERKLCRCVSATQPVSDAYRSTNRQGLRGGFDGFAKGDAVVASMLPGGNPVPGVVVGKHPDYLVVCFPQLGELVVVFEAELLTVTGTASVSEALAEYARRSMR